MTPRIMGFVSPRFVDLTFFRVQMKDVTAPVLRDRMFRRYAAHSRSCRERRYSIAAKASKILRICGDL